MLDLQKQIAEKLREKLTELGKNTETINTLSEEERKKHFPIGISNIQRILSHDKKGELLNLGDGSWAACLDFYGIPYKKQPRFVAILTDKKEDLLK